MGIKDRDPFEIFNDWLEEASQSEVNNPNAMALAMEILAVAHCNAPAMLLLRLLADPIG